MVAGHAGSFCGAPRLSNTPDHSKPGRSRLRRVTRRRALTGAGVLLIAPFVVSDKKPSVPGRFGFTISAPKPGLTDFARDLGAVVDLGAHWVRFGVVGFQAVQDWTGPDRPVFDEDVLNLYDQAFDLVEARGLSICLLTVDGVPAKRNTTDYLNTMGRYWSALSQRFGKRVALWQVFNEANDSDFRSAGEIEDDWDAYLEQLSDALAVARVSILRHAPRVRMTTNASGYPVDDAKEAQWLKFFAGISSQLDVCTLDLYPVLSEAAIASMPERIGRLSDATKLPVSVGEFGLQTGEGLYSEKQQVESLSRSIEAFSRSRADSAFVYRLRDDGARNDDGFGLYKIDGTPKSSVPDIAESIADAFPNG